MTKSRIGLMFGLIASIVYLIIGMIYYLSETSFLEGHPIFAAIYLALITAHAVIYGIGLIVSWLSFFFHKRGGIITGSIICIIAGIVIFPSLVAIIPIMIFILILNKKETKEKL